MGKSRQKPAPSRPKLKVDSPVVLSPTAQDIIFIVVLTSLLLFLLKPMVLDGLSPEGVDAIALKGKTHQILEYKKQTGETPLWNPYIFSGMPIYHLLSPVVFPLNFSLDNLINNLNKIIDSIFIYYLVAALGMYLLLRFLKMSPLISFTATLFFMLMPHYKSLYLEGHLAKFRAVTLIPWIFLTFLYFLEKRTLFTAALFALAFGSQIRTQHYQIVFYTAILILATGVHPFVKDLLEKNYKKFSRSTVYLFIAVFLGILMAAQPLFLAREYLPYSKRGKTSVDLASTQTQATVASSDGVSLQYATQWSTHPTELLTWLIPRYYGGMSGEKYDGTAVPQLRNRMIPGYWGYMPFTQSYEYMGVITLILAVIGIYAFRKNPLILSLIAALIYFILLSFGQYFESFYNLFYLYLPYFNKFRAPMMSVTISSFIITVLAAYGLQHLASLNLRQTLKEHRSIIIICSGFIILGALLWIFSQSFTFLKAGENYEPQVEELVKKIRHEFFTQDLIRYFIILVLSAIGILGYLTRRMNFVWLGLVLAVISLFDLGSIQFRYQKQFSRSDVLEKQYFRITSTDQFLQNDKEIYRIFPMGRLFGDNRWAYYHQTIGGYDPIKMYTIEELIENNLTTPIDGSLPVNWNILKILNVKYVVSQEKLEHPKLTLVHTDAAGGLNTYLFADRLPRGFFSGKYKVIQEEQERLRYLNNLAFNPESVAILEEDVSTALSKPDSSTSQLTRFTPDQSSYDVYTSQQALFVISECFYPPGWKILIDQKPVEKIYKANHTLQAIVVPAGHHQIDLRFEPASYYRNVRYARVALGLIYFIILAGSVNWFRRWFRLSDKAGEKI